MFIIKEGTTMMALTQGDSAYFTITIIGDVPADGTEALFTVKDRKTKKKYIEKRYTIYDGVINVGLTSQDTNKMKKGDYLWDLRVLLSDTDVVTPMESDESIFTVLEAVGDV